MRIIKKKELVKKTKEKNAKKKYFIKIVKKYHLNQKKN